MRSFFCGRKENEMHGQKNYDGNAEIPFHEPKSRFLRNDEKKKMQFNLQLSCFLRDSPSAREIKFNF